MANDYKKPATASASSSASSAQPTEAAGRDRVYRNTQEVDHDLFKLLVAKMKKNISYREDDPIFEDVEHCHFFHTFDSSGKPMDTSNSVGNHFHRMIEKKTSKGLSEFVCSPPMQWVKKKKGGKMQKVLQELDFDDHTHEVHYVQSQRITLRKANMEFAKVSSVVAARGTGAIPGIVES